MMLNSSSACVLVISEAGGYVTKFHGGCAWQLSNLNLALRRQPAGLQTQKQILLSLTSTRLRTLL